MAEQTTTETMAATSTSAAPKRSAEPRKPDAQGWIWATGRRKTAVARVRIRPGKGQFDVQLTRKKSKPVETYFTEIRDRMDVVAPMKLTSLEGKLDVVVRLHGGGFMGQAQALRLGLARAIKSYDPGTEASLRDAGFLTRDPREVERKKYGQSGARRRFQFSKR